MRTKRHPGEGATLAVRDSAGISKARRFVRRLAGTHLDSDRLSDVELVTSELVTNALEHRSDEAVDADVEVSVDVGDDVLDVSVVAPSADLPRLEAGTVPVTARRGRGLFIVTALCDNVAVSATAHRVRVSCQFNLG